jgi:hypothetical protein
MMTIEAALVRDGMKTMTAGKFKTKCLAVLDEVQAKRMTVIITKRGKSRWLSWFRPRQSKSQSVAL